ncbi:LLM class flavin-dependent oxidoreductase [Niallia nealsonii]|uniref:Nitrilotriacetate monooxygenase n=1 Tax=Niallia nealsonii TaxID=115979 RepID=A0A2N0Z097_9BACI|nr:LLM class flavin-dependent oxidoreductase [Niallia nealsonii]PKG22931.1 nitrilotriacetate monooxygenase [Niallia nealsonii]
MGKRNGQLRLGAFIYYSGHHAAGWRHPQSGVEDLFRFDMYKKLAQTAERGKFDMMFFADLLYAVNVEKAASGMLDPQTLLAALSAVTEKLGLTATVSTTYNEPYNVARKFATLDHISGGRSAWNIVTSQLDIEAHNYGKPKHPDHSLRYEMANEFVDLTKQLWNSWEDDALVLDRKKGQFADESKVKEIDFQGHYYASKGRLNVPRPPQGYPVLVVAGSSEPGIDSAGRYGEVVFTAQQSIESAKVFYQRIHAKLEEYGRSHDSLKIMPGISPIIGATEEEAWKKHQTLQDLISPEDAVQAVSQFINYDLSKYPYDQPLPDNLYHLADQSNGMKSRVQLLLDTAYKENLSILELGRKMLGARGHIQFVGTPDQLADLMEQWFDEYACDGFNIMPPVIPGDLDDFVDDVIPVLQKRGLFRKEYTGNTLREHLGLERPNVSYIQKDKLSSH